MASQRVSSEIRLVNGSTGDPMLYVDYPGRDDALLFDAGENAALEVDRLADLEAVFITHHHVDHFIGLDRIVRANIDADKTVSIFGPEGTIRKVYDRIKSYEYQYFPFQKIVLRINEILPGRIRWALLECTRRFPEPDVQQLRDVEVDSQGYAYALSAQSLSEDNNWLLIYYPNGTERRILLTGSPEGADQVVGPSRPSSPSCLYF